jgi:hypothetical protein
MKPKTLILGMLVAGFFISTAVSAERACKDVPTASRPGNAQVDRALEDPCGPVKQPPGNGNSGTSNSDACGAVLCLAGAALQGQVPTKCEPYIRKYFEIQVFSGGDFNPSKTFKKRRQFLDQCQSSDDKTRSDVNNRYGKSTGI